jgi:hypothetical protein
LERGPFSARSGKEVSDVSSDITANPAKHNHDFGQASALSTLTAVPASMKNCRTGLVTCHDNPAY